MSGASLTLVEYGEPVELHVSETAVEELLEHGEAWRRRLGLSQPPLEIGLREGAVTVRSRDVAGFLRIGDIDLEIAPKFLSGPAIESGRWRIALWRILAAVEENPLLAPPTLAHEEFSSSISDLMGWSFLASLAAGRLRGMPRGYVEGQDRLHVLRGRLDASRTSELVLRPWQIDCVFDDYSEDIAVNRLLRWAGEALAGEVLSRRLHRRLTEECAALCGVGSMPPGILEAERLVLQPQHRDLEPALTIARLLLRGHSLVHRRGSFDVHGFLWKSADVFERFVFRLMSHVARRVGGVRITKNTVPLGRPTTSNVRGFGTEPDVRFSDLLGVTRLVLDAKYKNWSGLAPKREDRYQVIIGGWVTGAKRVGLVYPAPNGIRHGPERWALLGPTVPSELVAVFVNLVEMAEPRGERQLVEELRQDLAGYL